MNNEMLKQLIINNSNTIEQYNRFTGNPASGVNKNIRTVYEEALKASTYLYGNSGEKYTIPIPNVFSRIKNDDYPTDF